VCGTTLQHINATLSNDLTTLPLSPARGNLCAPPFTATRSVRRLLDALCSTFVSHDFVVTYPTVIAGLNLNAGVCLGVGVISALCLFSATVPYSTKVMSLTKRPVTWCLHAEVCTEAALLPPPPGFLPKCRFVAPCRVSCYAASGAGGSRITIL
jgi:hypothetical protein